jgi:hypothetical protein
MIAIRSAINAADYITPLRTRAAFFGKIPVMLFRFFSCALRFAPFLVCLACCLSTPAARADAPLPAPATPAPLPAEEKSMRILAPGVELTTIHRNAPDAPLQLFIVKIDPQVAGDKAKWELRLAPAEYSVLKADTVSEIAKRENALIAVNGGYFAFGGAALGAVKVDGEWIRLPWKNRTALGIDENGGVLVDNLRADLTAGFAGLPQMLPVANFNGYPPLDGLAVLTTHFGTIYKLRPNEIAIEVQDGFVRRRVEAGAANVLRGGWTLVANGAARESLAAVAAGAAARLQFAMPVAWDKYFTILGAGPRLLKKGAILTTEKEEEFRPDVIARGPRTAFGVDANGRWIFLVADGRRPEYSVGLTIPELAREMQLAGAVEAICLDGGGSTDFVVNGEVLNRPSDGFERKVANALIVVPMVTNR